MTDLPILIVGAFAFLKKSLGGKLVGSDLFGRSEFYLGMMAGMVRWTCMLIVGLAVLNAREFNSAEIKSKIEYQKNVYGSDFFPELYSVQESVFSKSLTGPFVKKYLSALLITPTAPEKKELKRKELAL
jgi:hypothetical protein